MDFYNTTNTEDSLVHGAWDLCDANITSYPLADVARNMNFGLGILVGKIIGADGNWQWDDTNYSTLPIWTGTLVEGQQSYALGSFALNYLTIQMIEILDNSSPARYYKINPIDSLELNMSPEEYFGINSSGDPISGRPTHYDKIGDSLLLYPSPAAANITLTAGIRIWAQRSADLFTASDTTQNPGIPEPYHVLLTYYAALPYCTKYKKDRVAWLEKKWDEGVQDMTRFYGLREKDKPKRMEMRQYNFR